MNIYRSFTLSALAMFCVLCTLPGCWGEQKKTGLVVVNVLDKPFYDDCHIKGSINIPLEDVEKKMDTIDQNAEIVLYCSNYQCSTSEYVGQRLRANGFLNVSVYEGGTAEWYQAGLPVEGPHTQVYLSKPSRKLGQDNEQEIPVISMQELAQKMNVWHQEDVAA